MSSIAEVFPHDDPVARFMVAISMARNDVRHALRQVGQANDQGDPEFTYWIRVATGHFFEAELALREWRKVRAIKDFIAKLPHDAQHELGRASSAIQNMGPGVLQHSRNRTFHYPYPASRYQTDEELASALQTLRDEEVTVVVESTTPGLFRLHFADHVALALALGKYDRESLRTQAELVRDGAIGFVNFATRAWEAYIDTRGLSLGPPEPGRFN
jgi:hypothetical protein